MKNQYCRVGAVTPITGGSQTISVLEIRYQSFIEKAADATYMDTNLGEFFSRKAQGIKRILESLA